MLVGPILGAVLSIYDGDTVTVNCQIWPQFDVTAHVRINGIDTPEIRGKCPLEKELAILAREELRSMLGDSVWLHNIELGKFAGRVIADISVDGVDVAKVMIEQGHARPYAGGKRKGWCG
jgi:endonuclease YncB( thermonuclease family)